VGEPHDQENRRAGAGRGCRVASAAEPQNSGRDFRKTEDLLSLCNSDGSVRELLCLATIIITADAIENVAALSKGMVAISKEEMPASLEKAFTRLTPTERCGAGMQPTNGDVRDIVIKRIKKAGYTEADKSVDSIMVALATGPICKDTTE